jgi:putative DNA primase/helicase
LNKASGTSAIHRVNGSGAFVAAARAAYIVARDPLEADRRLFLPSKNNLGPDRTGLAYRIEEINGVPYIAWENEAVDISADDALGRPEERDHEETLANAAEEWLREVLALGPVATNDVKSFAKAAGYSWATVRRAQAAIDIKPKRVGGVAGAGQWAWSLPDGEEPDQMPLP